jgi:streptogramin lyase
MNLRRTVFGILIATALAGCKSTGIVTNPPSEMGASHIVIGDVGSTSIETFPATATGSVSPTYDVTGGSTGLNDPYDIYVDQAQNAIWVSNWAGGSNGTVTRYPLTANGNSAPSVTIGPGGSTTLEGPTGIYVSKNGTIYVADYDANAIDVFSAGSSGGVAPARRITSASLSEPEGLWLDSHGNIWVASASSDDLLEFAGNANGSATPKATISTGLTYPTGLFIDSKDDIWGVFCTADTSTAAVEEFNESGSLLRTIAGANTGMYCPYGIATDGRGYVYVADYYDSVMVFAPNATGNATPVRAIPANVTTGLSDPSAIGLY